MEVSANDRPDPKKITDDLRSGEPQRIAAGLAALDRAERRRHFVELPAPDLDSLAAFGTNLPEQVLTHFISTWQHYPSLVPVPDPGEIRHTLIEAVLRHGGEQPIFQVSLGLRTDDSPADAVRDVMRYLHDRDLDPTESA